MQRLAEFDHCAAVFQDRADAGRQLARLLAPLRGMQAGGSVPGNADEPLRPREWR